MRNPYDAIGRIGLLLAIVGAVNWLLVGLFEWNLVQWLFTDSGTQTVNSVGERVVYIVVGVGGLLAIPMLGASLARARGRAERVERDSSDRYVETDDTAYYLGAPKSEREQALEPRPLHVAETEPLRAEESTPMRRTERVVIRTEEPVTGMSGEPSGRSAGSPRSDIDERLRYGTVEETDEDYGERTEERRRAA
jgi:uncharacterized membrane protein YuzA (DUF378 family)